MHSRRVNCFLVLEHGDVIPQSNEELPMPDSPLYAMHSCLDSSTYGWLAKIGHGDQPRFHGTLRLQVHELYDSRVYDSDIADAVAKRLMNTGLQTSTPIVFGVLTCLNDEQVKARVQHGYDYGGMAVEMALFADRSFGW